MRISIALCTYNGAEFLLEQLKSISGQTRLPDELVVCDDCSQDSTVDIVRSFAETAPFSVRLFINKTNLRSTKNFERAISLCEGDIIFLSDQDDVWLPEKLRLFEAEFLKNERVGLVFCNAEVVDELLNPYNLTSWELCQFEGERLNSFKAGRAFEVLLKQNFISGCMMAFRAEYKSLVCPIPDDCLYMIHDYWIALSVTAVSEVVALPKELVKYRQHGKQQVGFSDKITSTPESSLRERAQSQTSFDEDLRRVLTLQKRLTENADLLSASTAAHIKQYIAHVTARGGLDNNYLRRVPAILRELTSLRYHRFSNGAKSAVKDLMSPLHKKNTQI